MSWALRTALLARSIVIRLWRRCAEDVGFWMAAGDTRSCVHTVVQGEAALTDKVCVFAHFDSGGVVRPHTRRYLHALIEEGFSLVFVSNSPLKDESLSYLSPQCYQILLRTNRGYDFAAYRDGILGLDIRSRGLAMLLLANDSVYAPITPLSDVFDKMDFDAADVWAATDSWQHLYHLQSYFVGFGPAALAHPAFLAFWRQVRNTRTKWAVVKHYEIGLTRALQSEGLRCAAVFDYYSLIRLAEVIVEHEEMLVEHKPFAMAALLQGSARRALWWATARIAANPVIDLWLLLAEAGSPFLKRELLRDNPTRMPELHAWHRMVQSRSPALYRDMIEDLKRVMRRSAP